MIITIISHTEHYINPSGQVVGWGPTIRELDHLTEIFDQVIHVAPLYNSPPPPSSLPYTSDKIKFVSLKPSGGVNLKDKLSVVTTAPHNLAVIREQLRCCDIFQFRAPTGIGNYIIPYLTLFSQKKGWFKYAGNWIQQNPPLSYRLQKIMVNSQNKRMVTINGKWDGQKPNQLTFENPCLTEQERKDGIRAIEQKRYDGKLNLIFVGRLEDAKGVQRILDVLSKVKNKRIGKVHLVGDGEKMSYYTTFVMNNCEQEIIFHGFLPKTKINKLLEESHLFLLPSDSEGFPKVIAEAANYGVIPIVSDVSSIGQYILEGETGFLVQNADEIILKQKLEHCLNIEQESLTRIAYKCYEMADKFTYSHYNNRIRQEIITQK